MTRYKSEDQIYKEYQSYMRHLDSMVKKGLMPKHEALLHIKAAKKNYKNQNYNRELDKIRGL